MNFNILEMCYIDLAMHPPYQYPRNFIHQTKSLEIQKNKKEENGKKIK